MKLPICPLILALSLMSCATPKSDYVYRQQSGLGFLGSAEYQSRRSWVLSEKAVIAVASLEPSHLTERQNQSLLTELVSRLSQDFVRVEAISGINNLYQQLAIADNSGAHYLVVPSFVSWQQRLNAIPELADNPTVIDIGQDAIAFKMALYDVPHARLLDVSLVRASSAVFTLKPTEPIESATPAFDLYVHRLSAAPHH